MLRKLFHILAAASVLAGCNPAVLDDVAETGWLVVDFSCFDDVRAGETDLSDYTVVINGVSSDYSLESICGELPAVLELLPGDYEISVSSPDAAPAMFDTPIYSSSEEFTIVAGKTRSVSLLLSNVQVTMIESSSFNASTVKSCSITVSNGYASLTWSLGDVAGGRTGYFADASVLYINLEGEAMNGTALSYSDVIYDVERSQHHRITLGEYVPVI